MKGAAHKKRNTYLEYQTLSFLWLKKLNFPFFIYKFVQLRLLPGILDSTEKHVETILSDLIDQRWLDFFVRGPIFKRLITLRAATKFFQNVFLALGQKGLNFR